MLEAAVFDMDGLLIDSEPLWRRAEQRIFADLGVPLTEEMCLETTGVRLNEVVRLWHSRFPWEGRALDDVAADIIATMIDLVRTEGAPMEGVEHVLELFEARGLRLALASSSPVALIDAVLDCLGIRARFEVIRSAEPEPYGKPHPGVFLSAAGDLDVEATRCLVLEDSFTGVIAGLAARMKVVAVPAPEERDQPRFDIAHARLESLLELDGSLLDRLSAL